MTEKPTTEMGLEEEEEIDWDTELVDRGCDEDRMKLENAAH